MKLTLNEFYEYMLEESIITLPSFLFILICAILYKLILILIQAFKWLWKLLKGKK